MADVDAGDGEAVGVEAGRAAAGEPAATAAATAAAATAAAVPPPELKAGTVPDTVRSVSVRPPAAAATLSSLEIVVTLAALSEESVKSLVSVLSLILLPAAGRLLVPVFCRKLNPNPPPPAALVVGVFVTVMSVPTP